MIDKAQITEDYVRRNLGREARIMSRLRHPHIAALYEAIESGHLVCLVTELAPGGDLCSHVKAQVDGRLHEASARPFLRQIVSALTYMHGRGVIHRDLKMENVMLDKTKTQVKIVDFGLSNFYGPGVTLQTHCGSPEYAAPELFVPGRPYGPEVDVWSLGVIMYGALTGCLPFLSPRTDGANPQERRHRLYRKIQQGLGQHHWKALANISPECRDLLLSLLTANPEKRISLDCVQIHPYITASGCCPVNDYLPPGINHPDAPKVFLRLSELLKVPVAFLESEVERDDHCEVAAMFYLLFPTLQRSQSDLVEESDVCYPTIVDSDQSIAESAPFLPPESSPLMENLSPTPKDVSTETAKADVDEENSQIAGGAGESDVSQPVEPEVKAASATVPVASGDGVVVSGIRSRSQQRKKDEGSTTPRAGNPRRLNLRRLCFKGQSSDASLTNHLLLDKHLEVRRRQKRDDEEEGKRRPKASGDSCFCMLNYANQSNIWTEHCWKLADCPVKGVPDWQYIVKTSALVADRSEMLVLEGKNLMSLSRWLPLQLLGPEEVCSKKRRKKFWALCVVRLQFFIGGVLLDSIGRLRRRRKRRRRRPKRCWNDSKGDPDVQR